VEIEMIDKRVLLCLLFLVTSCTDSNIVSDATKFSEKNNATELVKNKLRASRSIIFRYEIKNTTDRLLDSIHVSVAIPVVDSARHEITKLDANINGGIEKGVLGDQKYVIELQNLPPFSSKILTVKVQVTNRNSLHLDKAESQSLFLAESAAVPFHMSEFSAPISIVRGATELETVKNAYRWVIKHMHYTGYLPKDYGAFYALKNARGDCTEYMHLLAALLRGNGIPTKLVAGYVYNQNSIAVAADYHNWVEVFIGGTWRVVDAQLEHFMDDDQKYISMVYLDSSVSEQGQKFSASDENISVRMF
jgi:hypothetical protein